MNLLQKMIFGFVGIALFIAVVTGVAIYGGQKIEQSYDKAVFGTLPEIIELEKIRSSCLRMAKEALAFEALGEDSRSIQEEHFLMAKEQIEKWETAYEERVSVDDPMELQFVKAIDASGGRVKSLAAEIIALKKETISVTELSKKIEELEEAEILFLDLIEKVIEHENQELAENHEMVDQSLIAARNLLVGVAGLLILLAVVFGYLIAESVSGPIVMLKDMAIKIGKGKYDTRIDIKSKDEVGVLSNAFNEMAEGLSRYHSHLEELVEERTKELETTNKKLQREITERKLAEEEKKQQSEFLSLVIESLAHPFYVIDVSDYTIKLANSAVQLGGLLKESTCYALTHKSDRPCTSKEHICPLEIVKKTKKSATVEHIHYDKDGRPRNFEVRAHPILDSDGNVTQVIEYSLDITDRKQVEEALRDSEAKFRSLFNDALDMIHIVDKNGKIMDANPVEYQTMGYSREEYLGMSILKIIHPDYQELAKIALKKVAMDPISWTA